MKKRKNRNSKHRGAVLMIALLVLFGAMIGGVMYWESVILPEYNATLPPVTEATDPQQTETATPTEAPTEATMPTLGEDAMNGKQVLNILITGQDRRDAEGWGRSDTMILCSINAQTDSVTMVSFLRDLYLPIPGHGSSRLNAAYSWGGVELLNKTLAQNFDVPIDGNIEIDFYDFMDLIDYLGGVEVELTQKEANYLNENGNWGVEKDAQWNLTEGRHLLTGSQALAYSRIRYIDSDFVRTERQRTVLTQVMGKLNELSWSQLSEALEMLLANSSMSFSSEELFFYTLGFYPVLTDGEIVTGRVPADGTWKYATVSGMSIIKADAEANKAYLRELLRVDD